MSTIKLYTEEQVKDAIRLAREKYPPDIVLTEQGILMQFEPIELPSDEEIENLVGNGMHDYYKGSFSDGAKWVIEQLKQVK